MRKLIGLSLALAVLGVALPSFAAVSFHAVNSGCGNPNGGSITCNLPTVSANDYVLCGVIQSLLPATNTTSWNTPAGWTLVYGGPILSVFGQVWTSGSSVTISPSAGSAGSWEAGICVSYSGVNTSTPIDGAANGASWNLNATAGSLTSTANCEAPSVSPAWTTDMLAVFYAAGGAGGGSVSFPGALTSRGSSGPGPTIAEGDELLASGAATGILNATLTGAAQKNCVQIPLLPASGGTSAATAVIPTLGAAYFLGNDIGSANYGTTLFPVNGDLIVLSTLGAGSSCSITGSGSWTQVFQTADVGLFTHQYSTGDTTTFTQSNCTTNYATSIFAVRNYNPTGGALTSPAVDVCNTSTQASSTTITSASLTLASANEILVVTYSSGDNSVNNSGTCSVPGGLTTDFAGHYRANTESGCQGELIPSSTTPGGFTGTFSSSGRLGSGAVAFKIGAGATVIRHKVSQN